MTGVPFQMHIMPSSGLGRCLHIEEYVVRDHEVEFSVAVIIDESATRSP